MSSEANVAKITAGFKAVNDRDFDAFLALLEPDFKLNLVLKPEMLQAHGEMQGREGFKYYLNLLNTAFPDYVMEQVSINAHGNMVYQQINLRATHLGNFILPNGIKIPPTGLRVMIPTEVYHTFDQNGAFKSSTGYANLLDVMRQFGR